MSVGVLRNSNKGLDISELILETTEELKQHLKQMDTASTRQMAEPFKHLRKLSRSYPLESHPHQQQSIQPLHSQQRSPSPPVSAGPTAVNPRQKARDLLLKAFGQREGQTLSRGGITVQSSATGGGETLQTTVGRGGGSITPSSSTTILKQRKGLKGWLSGGREETEKAKFGFSFWAIISFSCHHQ